MNKGFVFRNGTIGYTVLDYAETYSGNIALLRRDAYCPYVAARVLQKQSDGKYIWAWGNYFNELPNAENYFHTRTNEPFQNDNLALVGGSHTIR